MLKGKLPNRKGDKMTWSPLLGGVKFIIGSGVDSHGSILQLAMSKIWYKIN